MSNRRPLFPMLGFQDKKVYGNLVQSNARSQWNWSTTIPRTLNDWAHDVHALAVEKGWWDENGSRNFGEAVALIHAELSESLESYRHNEARSSTLQGKPEGYAVELVDVLIRTLDLLESLDVDVDALMEQKHNYNKTRPYRHGNLLA